MGNKSGLIAEKYVVGIDFGTAGIGYAFASNINNYNYINPVLSELKNQCDNKVPNEIIFDKDLNKVLAFGNDCSSYISSKHKNDYHYFKDIKMNLYDKQYTIKSTNGVEFDIEIIISKILTEISKKAINEIENSYKTVKKEDIKWVVTIPAIFEEKSKEIMVNASKNAGLIKENTDLSLFLALEPEVAAIFYFYNLYKNINHQEKEKQKQLNNPFIICDIGAGTVDICAFNKDKNKNTLIEEYPPIGGNYGGNYINKEFKKRIIVELFGEEKLKKVKNDIEYERYLKFEKDIEDLKRELTEDETIYRYLDCKIFKDTNKSLNDYIYEYNKKDHNYKYNLKINENEEWELLIPNKVFLDITKEMADKIYLKLKEVYDNIKNAQIIFTGAGSNNNILIKYIKQLFNEKNDIFKKTIQSEVAILKGSVIFGFKNNIIRKRKPKYTIGINIAKEWDEKLYKDGGIKSSNKIDNRDMFINLFKKFITRNEYIKYNQIISHVFLANSMNSNIIFYKTLKNDCKYINEKGIEKFGDAKFKINNLNIDNRKIKIDMKMGGTYIYVTATYLQTGENISIDKTFV